MGCFLWLFNPFFICPGEKPFSGSRTSTGALESGSPRGRDQNAAQDSPTSSSRSPRQYLVTWSVWAEAIYPRSHSDVGPATSKEAPVNSSASLLPSFNNRCSLRPALKCSLRDSIPLPLLNTRVQRRSHYSAQASGGFPGFSIDS